jgi:hypothetical protein
MTTKLILPSSETSPKKRGGQRGNTNALKHGFYSSRFNPKHLAMLKDADPTSVKDLIFIFHLLIFQMIDQPIATFTPSESYELNHNLCMSSFALTRLLRYQHLLAKDGSDEFNQQINEALDMLRDEWHLE